MTASVSATSANVPSTKPAQSGLPGTGSALSGTRATVATSSATASTTLNQKMARQPLALTSTPPRIGPKASATPHTADHTPIARARSLARG